MFYVTYWYLCVFYMLWKLWSMQSKPPLLRRFWRNFSDWEVFSTELFPTDQQFAKSHACWHPKMMNFYLVRFLFEEIFTFNIELNWWVYWIFFGCLLRCFAVVSLQHRAEGPWSSLGYWDIVTPIHPGLKDVKNAKLLLLIVFFWQSKIQVESLLDIRIFLNSHGFCLKWSSHFSQIEPVQFGTSCFNHLQSKMLWDCSPDRCVSFSPFRGQTHEPAAMSRRLR